MEGKQFTVTNAMWVRTAIMAYVDGDHSLSSIIGVIETADDAEAARRFLDELEGFGDPERREHLRRRLEAEAA
jgi:hypothetical protein